MKRRFLLLIVCVALAMAAFGFSDTKPAATVRSQRGPLRNGGGQAFDPAVWGNVPGGYRDSAQPKL
jgi:hypothetical protein